MLEINKFHKIIAANWKLNASFDFIDSYFQNLNINDVDPSVCGIVCPPSIFLNYITQKNINLFIGAQDCSNFDRGPYTGEVSASMLKEQNCQFCIIGHSERRSHFLQSNTDISLKANNLFNNDIIPIICIGETLEEKKDGKTKTVLFNQVIQSIPGNIKNNRAIIAYEPIWAIGSGIMPSLEEIAKIHNFLKNDIKEFNNFKILYGGSVKPNNAKDIMSINNVDGLLVGGASLDPFEFEKILKA